MAAVSTATGCEFSCKSGYVKSGRACNYPPKGSFVNAQGDELPCNDISSSTPNFGFWVLGAATDADSCPFSCGTGYTVSGRTCTKAIPKMLALGRYSSHVLFDNGEVESWGKVSDHTWRSHIKENLGNNTPQALMAGAFHQCIILKNGGLDHGRLMCWGNNGNGRLGVGDSKNRSTPTAVTINVLGADGNGNPNTVKSVAAGQTHTCAILYDDTVKCWGRNNYGQIGGGGGGISTPQKTISGTTVGDPLDGKTASRIAAGSFHTCAILTTDDSVQCWGNNRLGRTGGGTLLDSDQIAIEAIEIAAGERFTCAILKDGSLQCWGSMPPPPSLGGKSATKIAAGGVTTSLHACAILSDKTVKCWGHDVYGQKGGGTSGSNRVLRGTSSDPLDGRKASHMAAGGYHTCAIMESDNSVKCWGGNIDVITNDGFYGQIVGEVAMTGGSDGTGTSTGETLTLTADSTPTATSLGSDEHEQICNLTLSGGTLGNTWVAKEYSTSITYNTNNGTSISAAIDNLIKVIGSPVNIAGTNVTLSTTGTDKIAATTDSAVFDGMTLTIYHDDNSGDCTNPVGTPIALSGGSGAADKAEGLWVISQDYTYDTTGSGDDNASTSIAYTLLLEISIFQKRPLPIRS